MCLAAGNLDSDSLSSAVVSLNVPSGGGVGQGLICCMSPKREDLKGEMGIGLQS